MLMDPNNAEQNGFFDLAQGQRQLKDFMNAHVDAVASVLIAEKQ